MSRTNKREYTKSKKVSKQCRNNGECDYCRSNRLHKHRKQLKKFKDLEDYNDDI